jgi:hypothetical protein
VARSDTLPGTAQSHLGLVRALLPARRRTVAKAKAKRKLETIMTQMQKNSQLNASVGRGSARFDPNFSLSLEGLPLPALLHAL